MSIWTNRYQKKIWISILDISMSKAFFLTSFCVNFDIGTRRTDLKLQTVLSTDFKKCSLVPFKWYSNILLLSSLTLLKKLLKTTIKQDKKSDFTIGFDVNLFKLMCQFKRILYKIYNRYKPNFWIKQYHFMYIYTSKRNWWFICAKWYSFINVSCML